MAHLGFFHDEFVSRRKWITEEAYADLVALCQFLPGPASSQVGMALGFLRAGYLGSIAAWIAFTFPSAILLVLFAYGISELSGSIHSSYLHGLKVVAVAVVAHAIWNMSKKICRGAIQIIIAIVSALLVLLISSAFTQIGVIILGALLGILFLRDPVNLPHVPFMRETSRRGGAFLLIIFFLLLSFLPMLAQQTDSIWIKQFDSFFRAGSLVFGGGHVVLPLLSHEVVTTGWVSKEAFMAGYGAAQAIPGPLFSFSAYLGAVSNGITGALLCLIAAFLPSYLLILGVLPFWEKLRKFQNMKFAMKGINAAVIGLLLAAFYHPVWTSAIFDLKDLGVALGAFLLLNFTKIPSWLVVILTMLTTGIIQ